MHHHCTDLTGKKIGNLTVLGYAGSNGVESIWKVRCECGNVVEKKRGCLRVRSKNSALFCGLKGCSVNPAKTTNRTHGLSGHPLHYIHDSMISRCHRDNNASYHRYGGRGIKVCDRWRSSFKNFYDDMIEGYRKGLHIDRIDNNGDYEPGNCRWVTCKRNLLNREDTVYVNTPDGERIPAKDACEKYGIKYTTLLYRLNHGVKGEQLFVKADVTNRFNTD